MDLAFLLTLDEDVKRHFLLQQMIFLKKGALHIGAHSFKLLRISALHLPDL